MANVEGGGGSDEWNRMDEANQAKVNAWLKSDEMQSNREDDGKIGVPMSDIVS